MITNSKIPGCRSAVAALALVLLAGCSTGPATIDTTGEATFDGLYPVKGGRMDEAWARPDTDLTVYTKVMLEGAGVEFRPGGNTGNFTRTGLETIRDTKYCPGKWKRLK